MAEELVKITVRQDPAQRDVTIFPDLQEGVRSLAGFRFRYVGYTSTWWLWLVGLDYVPYYGGIQVVPGIDLLARAKFDPRTPQGELFVYSADRTPPRKDTLDVEAVLYYRRPT